MRMEKNCDIRAEKKKTRVSEGREKVIALM